MEELLNELRGCMKAADNVRGIHKKVIDDAKWSGDYIRKIKNGTTPEDTKENRDIIWSMINRYETLLHEHVRNIKVIKPEIL